MHTFRTLLFLVSTGAFGTLASAQEEALGALERDIVYWDAPRADGSLYGGRIELAVTAKPADGFRVLAPVTTRRGLGGPDNRVDLVLVGDGYTSTELAQFHQDAASLVASFFAHEPFTTYVDYFDVHMVDVVSAESGVDNDPSPGVDRDTALDMGFWCGGIERLLCIDVGKAYSYANNAPDVDHVIALANSTKYGGAGYSGSDLATSSGQNGSSSEIVVHELGHSFGNLADEYHYSDGAQWNGGELGEPNVSIQSTAEMASSGTKWAAWLGENVGAFDGLVDTYEGARYYQFGIRRPTSNSLMRSLGRPFNLPSVESLVIQLYAHVSPIDDHADDGTVYDGSETLWVVPMSPGGTPLPTQWNLDGVEIPGATAASLDLATLDLAPCAHVVSAVVHDPTPWVRDESARASSMTARVDFVVDPSAGGMGCIGNTYCSPAVPNSTGQPGRMTVVGSASVAQNDVTLVADQLPLGQFGYFLTSETQGFVQPPGSQGFLCLAGNAGRYTHAPGQGPSFALQIDLTSMPVSPPTAVQPGDTWNFQAWYRDAGGTSNFTDGVSVTFG